MLLQKAEIAGLEEVLNQPYRIVIGSTQVVEQEVGRLVRNGCAPLGAPRFDAETKTWTQAVHLPREIALQYLERLDKHHLLEMAGVIADTLNQMGIATGKVHLDDKAEQMQARFSVATGRVALSLSELTSVVVAKGRQYVHGQPYEGFEQAPTLDLRALARFINREDEGECFQPDDD